MTHDEAYELLNTFMIAVSRMIDAKSASTVRSEICLVRLIDDDNVYVRPHSDISTPSNATPESVSQLDDGDIRIPNISGLVLSAGDSIEIIYTTSIEDAVIIRKVAYTPVSTGGGGGGGSGIDPYNSSPQMNGTASAGVSSKYARGDHVHPHDTDKANVDSPTFTGTPSAPTANAGTNTTQLATTAFVQTAIAALNAVPTGGQTGYVLTKTSGGYTWQALPTYDGSVT